MVCNYRQRRKVTRPRLATYQEEMLKYETVIINGLQVSRVQGMSFSIFALQTSCSNTERRVKLWQRKAKVVKVTIDFKLKKLFTIAKIMVQSETAETTCLIKTYLVEGVLEMVQRNAMDLDAKATLSRVEVWNTNSTTWNATNKMGEALCSRALLSHSNATP